MNNSVLFDKIGVIIVLYFPTVTQLKRLKKLESFKYVIVVDNTPDIDNSGLIPQGIDYFPLKANRGIAIAQNIGVEIVKSFNVDYIVFFDQDSCYSEELINNLYNSYCEFEEIDIKIGAIGPKCIDPRNLKKFHPDRSLSLTPQKHLISSGTFCSIIKFNAIGWFEDNLFIDLVDYEWSVRAINKGYHLYMANEVIMPHTVGKSALRFLHSTFVNSAPKRYYYQYRNYIWLSKRKYVPTEWKFKQLYNKILGLILYPIITKKLSTLKWIIKGVFDGLRSINSSSNFDKA